MKTNRLLTRLRELVRFQRLKLTEWRFGSLPYCDSPLQNQQSHDHLMPSNASATDSENPGTCNKPFVNDLERQNNNSEQAQERVHKYYLCDYWYQGKQWCIEIPASSWEDAQKRLRSLSQGKVVGKIEAVIPGKLGFLAKLIVWLKAFNASV
jgi:hypothetical protein